MPGYDQFPHVHCQSLLNLILAEYLTKFVNKTLINVNIVPLILTGSYLIELVLKNSAKAAFLQALPRLKAGFHWRKESESESES